MSDNNHLLLMDVSEEEHQQALKRLKMQQEMDDFIKVIKNPGTTYLGLYPKPKPNDDNPLQERAHAPIESTHRLDHISLIQDKPVFYDFRDKKSSLPVILQFNIIKKLVQWVSSLFYGAFGKDEDKVESILRK